MDSQEILNYQLMLAVGKHFKENPDLAWDAMASVYNWLVQDLDKQILETIQQVEEDPETVEGAYSNLLQSRWDDSKTGLPAPALLTKAAKAAGIQ